MIGKRFSSPAPSNSSRSSSKHAPSFSTSIFKKAGKEEKLGGCVHRVRENEDGDDSSPCSGPYGQSHPTPNFARSDDEGTRDGFAISGPKGGREARSRVGIGIREEREGVITFPEQIDDQLAPPPTPLKLGHGRHLGFHGRKGDPGRRVWL